MFLGAARSQWRTAGMGGLLGLDYAGAESVARAFGIAWSEDLLLRLQMLEDVAVRAMQREAGE